MLEALRRSLVRHREPFHSDSKKPRGAVALIFKEEANDLWLLMIRRAENPRDRWSGQMAFPGGHADQRDRTLLDTASREAMEEVGINMSDHEFLGCLHNVEPRSSPIVVAPFVFLLVGDVHPTLSREAREILWIPMSFFLNSKNVSSIIVAIGERDVSMGCYVYLDHTIWGLSFRIIQELLSKIASC